MLYVGSPLDEVGLGNARVTGAFQAALIRLTYSSWRVDLDASNLDVPLARGRRVMLAFWHGKYVPIFAALSGRRACIFTSLSRRGAVIAEICRRFGYEPVMIPDRGADASYEAMREALESHNACGIAADGPLGPFHVVKRGLVRLASELDYRIVTCSVASRPKRTFTRRWDRMEIPRPFARVCLSMSNPICVPRNLDDASVDLWCTHVRHQLEQTDSEAEAMLGA